MFVSFISRVSVPACKMHHQKFSLSLKHVAHAFPPGNEPIMPLLHRMLSSSGNWYANYAKPPCRQSHNRGSAIILKNKNNDRFPPVPAIRYCVELIRKLNWKKKSAKIFWFHFHPIAVKKSRKKNETNQQQTSHQFPKVTHEPVTGPKKNLIPATN